MQSARSDHQSLEVVAWSLVAAIHLPISVPLQGTKFKLQQAAPPDIGDTYTVVVDAPKFGVVWTKTTGVKEVKVGSAAAAAGVIPGSRLVAIDGKAVGAEDSFKVWVKTWSKARKRLPFPIVLKYPQSPSLVKLRLVKGHRKLDETRRNTLPVEQILMHTFRVAGEDRIFRLKSDLIAAVAARSNNLAVKYLDYLQTQLEKIKRAVANPSFRAFGPRYGTIREAKLRVKQRLEDFLMAHTSLALKPPKKGNRRSIEHKMEASPHTATDLKTTQNSGIISQARKRQRIK